MDGPRNTAFDSGNNRLFVGEADNNRVLVYDIAAITNGENAVNVLGQVNFTSGGSNGDGSANANQSGMSRAHGDMIEDAEAGGVLPSGVMSGWPRAAEGVIDLALHDQIGG